MHLSQRPVEYRLPPLLLSEHTRAVLQDLLGLDDESLARLGRDAII